ncbi:MAG: hypothetical protein SGCHY_001892 [Lobulomycetales sp.]
MPAGENSTALLRQLVFDLELDSDPDLSNHEHEVHKLYVRTLFMLILIVLTLNIHAITHKLKFHFLGHSALTILVGLIVAVIFTLFSYSSENTTIQLSSTFFYMVLLPPIIFESGFNLRKVSFFKNFGTIVGLSFVGALYSSFVTSFLMFFFSKLVLPLSFIESLVFGCLISSTDPVTVLSLLPTSVDKRLYMLIFGESALNDAVSIILYRFFTSIADPQMGLGPGPIFLSILTSSGVFLGSCLCGVAIGLIYAKITKEVHMPNRSMYELTMLLLFGYLSYLIADVLHLAGIISIFFCGIAMAHYAYPNLSEEAVTSLQVAILIARTHVFLIIGTINYFAKKPEDVIPMNHQILMWFSGLRGAVAFALGVTFLEHPLFAADVKGMIFGTTVMIVVLSVIILGGFTPFMLRHLRITEGTARKLNAHPSSLSINTVDHGHDSHADRDPPDSERGYAQIDEETEDEDGGLPEDEEMDNEETKKQTGLFAWLVTLDARFIRPIFSYIPPPPIQTPASVSPGKRSVFMKEMTPDEVEMTTLKSAPLTKRAKSPTSATFATVSLN